MSRRATPCVGICSTTLGDDVCRGCRRTFEEVLRWNQMSDDEKEVVWRRLEADTQED